MLWRGEKRLFMIMSYERFEVEDRGDGGICRYFAINSEDSVRRNNTMYISTFAG